MVKNVMVNKSVVEKMCFVGFEILVVALGAIDSS